MKSKNYLLFAIAISVLLAAACSSEHSHEKVEKRYSLGPNAKNTIAFKAKTKTRVYFIVELTSQERAKCENQCIRMYYMDKKGEGEAILSPVNGNLDIEPEAGNISVVIQNMEKFPIALIVGRKAL